MQDVKDASRYCSYTASTPSLPTPKLTGTPKIEAFNDAQIRLTNVSVSNSSSFPSGTSFSYTLINNTRGTSITSSSPTTYRGDTTAMDVRNDSFSLRITAQCSGYKSSSSTVNVTGWG